MPPSSLPSQDFYQDILLVSTHVRCLLIKLQTGKISQVGKRPRYSGSHHEWCELCGIFFIWVDCSLLVQRRSLWGLFPWQVGRAPSCGILCATWRTTLGGRINYEHVTSCDILWSNCPSMHTNTGRHWGYCVVHNKTEWPHVHSSHARPGGRVSHVTVMWP